MDDNKPFEVQDSRVVYQNPWIKVREDKIVRQHGAQGVYAHLEVNDSVCVVAVDDQGRICLIEAYRHPFDGWFWELPGGGGEGDDLLQASKRELEEETGTVATNWTKLGRVRVYSGLSTEWQTNVLATELEIGDFVQREDEIRDCKFVTLDELDRLIASGEVSAGQTITAVYMYKEWLRQQ